MYQNTQTLCFPFNLGSILANEADTEAVVWIPGFYGSKNKNCLACGFYYCQRIDPLLFFLLILLDTTVKYWLFKVKITSQMKGGEI